MRDFPEGAAVVIGGSGGVGRAICECLADHGTAVAFTYRSNQDAARQVEERVGEKNVGCLAQSLALQEADAVVAFLADVESALGPIHTVINAAGASIPMQFISEVTPEKWREVMQADADGFFHLVKAAIPRLRERGGGSFVAITSSGLARYPTRDILSVAPKAAIQALVTGIAREEGRFGIRANNVALGVIDAGMFQRLRGTELSDEWLEAAKRNSSLRRFGTAREVAEVAVFLASAKASYVTGQTIYVDGGYTL